MKIIDRNGRLFGKISVIDLLVIAVVAVMAVALYVKTNQKEITSTTTQNTPITFQILVRGVRSYVADAVAVGDAVYEVDRSTGGALGTITDVQVSPGSTLAQFRDGTAEYVPVEAEGLVSNGRYQLNRIYDLGVNSSRNFHTKYVQFVGSVFAIQ